MCHRVQGIDKYNINTPTHIKTTLKDYSFKRPLCMKGLIHESHKMVNAGCFQSAMQKWAIGKRELDV